VCFQRIGGKLDAFAAKMQPFAAKNRGKTDIFLPERQKIPGFERPERQPDRPVTARNMNGKEQFRDPTQGPLACAKRWIAGLGPLFKIFLRKELRAFG
jgi:hypothetical protein